MQSATHKQQEGQMDISDHPSQVIRCRIREASAAGTLHEGQVIDGYTILTEPDEGRPSQLISYRVAGTQDTVSCVYVRRSRAS
jgi:hypothetical protein